MRLINTAHIFKTLDSTMQPATSFLSSPQANFQPEARANTAFARVMDSAPMGLLLSAALGLAIVGVFQYIFYLDVLPVGWQSMFRHIISGAIALFFEALGLFFLITTVRDFSARHRREGWLGAVASVLLLIYALYEVNHVAAVFDRDTPETYATIYSILATIIVIVRVVELRIALTVTAAIARADERKIIAELTGQLAAFQAEKADTERRKLEAEEAERRIEEQRHEQEIEAMFAEVEALRRYKERHEKRTGENGQPLDGNKRAEIERRVRKFYKETNLFPTQEQAAKLAGLKDARSLRYYFPNGAWDALEQQIIATPQPETAI